MIFDYSQPMIIVGVIIFPEYIFGGAFPTAPSGEQSKIQGDDTNTVIIQGSIF